MEMATLATAYTNRIPVPNFGKSSNLLCCFSFSPTCAALLPFPEAGHDPAPVTIPVILPWATLPGTLPPRSQSQLIYAGFVNTTLLPCLPLHTTPLITCRLKIMRTLVTLKILANWGFLLWESSAGAWLKIATKLWEKLFLFQVCLAFLRKKILQATSYAWGCFSRMSGFQLKLWSHHLLQLKNTHTDCFSNSHHPNQNMWHHSFYRCKNAISLFHTQYWITSLIRRKLWVWEAGLETDVKFVKVTVCWFLIKISFFFRNGSLLYVFLYLVVLCLFLSILVLLPYCLFSLAFHLP